MTTNRYLSVVGEEFAAFVRGPLFLVALSLVFLFAPALLVMVSPARATLLQGGLTQTEVVDSSTIQASAALTEGSFPTTYIGVWHSVSVVTNSAVHSVPIGQQVESRVRFAQTQDGRTLAFWDQPGWTQTESTITPGPDLKFVLDRTSYFVDRGMNGGWAAHSRDLYKQVSGDQIVAQSAVDQYIDGQYLGRYQTRSVLYRVR